MVGISLVTASTFRYDHQRDVNLHLTEYMGSGRPLLLAASKKPIPVISAIYESALWNFPKMN